MTPRRRPPAPGRPSGTPAAEAPAPAERAPGTSPDFSRELAAAACLTVVAAGERAFQADADLAEAAAQGPDRLAAAVLALTGGDDPLDAAVRLALRRSPRLARALRGEPGGGRTSYDFTLQILGVPAVFDHRRGEAVRWRLRRSLQVVAFLASAPDHSAGRGELEAAIWPGADHDELRRNFHPTISHLRHALPPEEGLGPAVVLDSGVYRLNRRYRWRIDADEFCALAQAGSDHLEEKPELARTQLAAAWRLYRGELLAGWDAPWVLPRREALHRRYTRLLGELGGLHLAAGRLDDALDCQRALLLAEPLQEPAHVAVMQLYARLGRRDLVRVQFDRLCELLLEELGSEPLPDTTAEYHRLMS